ncbi:flagellar basal body protein FliL [Solimonas fluminis]|uniref:Flagellar protein FliL n=1 Tax=Solimonas fluminis TaxID=2086571 RepID=A0A2S5TGI6_9GAMM|nr:flagellar basal body-associated FliL family protein [Solimonas fluminis]PPE74089.1 flagellar basal body protein FliL [Solimonas fluminis]
MSAAAKTADEGDIPPAAVPKAKAPVLAMIVAVMVSAAASGGAAFWFSSHGAAPAAGHGEEAKKEAPPKAPAQYLALDPAFVVNLEDPDASRFLQLEIQVMARDAAVLEAVKLHQPRIRNALLLLLGQQRTAQIADRAGKEKLQAAVLAEIQKILKDETGKPGVEAVYFTSFVTQ